jgi:hypothetical protein
VTRRGVVRRFPLYVFGGLVVATVAAFFITQHLKVSTPFFAGFPRPAPADINPLDPHTCKGVYHGRTHISFYLLNRGDDVNMYVVDSNGTIVRTVASDRHMGVKQRRLFIWNGRESDGTIAPDGTYYFRVALIEQGRSIDVGGPIHVNTTPPHPVVYRVTPNLIPQGSTPATIKFRGNEGFRSRINIYRTDLPGRPRLVDHFVTKHRPTQATWNGTIDGLPAPAGTYTVGCRRPTRRATRATSRSRCRRRRVRRRTRG